MTLTPFKSAEEGKTVWIVPGQVAAVAEMDVGQTLVYLVGGDGLLVLEPCEDVVRQLREAVG